MQSEFRIQYNKMQDNPNPPSTLVWQLINIIMTVFFCLAAYVNLNDDDWYVWVPGYTVPALLSLTAAFKPSIANTTVWGSLAVVDFTLSCAYAVYAVVITLEAVGHKVANPLQHEEGREMGGVFIIIAWLGIARFTNIGRPGASVTNKSLMNALLLMTVTLTLLPLFTWSLCFVSDWHTKLAHCNNMFKQ
ncbi:transmembrane protein 220-like [Ylistrum balloti]|uniref:transmembrane protein 220-like n=1 Tax=Ylistrum balloti TaxID=509963 RepID=UPI002905ACCA|nr:transmembrane protein 220-like [Ylistrum balloti]XP_060063454.1 transmembrane protein 220-like [Ylistrum balloti]XP_060063455.1 transmembrane protein 220-like [Ylistrum balloti]